MRTILLLTTLALSLVVSAVPRPQHPGRSPALAIPPRATNIGTGRKNTAPYCGLANVTQPANTLPTPSAGLNLVLIAQGTGTQNYTCANNSATALPVAIGAVATLVNASCAVATGNLGSINEDSQAVGMHFFVDSTTPDFNIIGLGNTELKKLAAVAAPAEADGSVDVPWLKLVAQAAGTTSLVKEVYRLVTKGGTAPVSCAGQAAVVQVKYQAEYWFYASPS
ncbi:hypothetical protein K432DRAFT_382889 [Lepidopterella palustris CBS 459.81]|uniref:Malate dehydrogenase n=1 Tax=Lepidopterella palustris CBS 459.81 TaxID=1314670 RepID=A0A8E2JEQ3_9PEZI|nr:hypothetical protein K432DRAFT_382889 [Lepidopterella palustris CBS 459.81]